VAHPLDRGRQLDAADLDFVAACPLIGGSASDLRPVLTTHYTRATLLLEADVRVTVDVDLHAVGPDGRMVVLPDTAVIETKSGGPPTEADRLLWQLGHRPMKVSKFGTSLSVLYPGLPGNKWTRARRWPWVARRGLAPVSSLARDSAAYGPSSATPAASTSSANAA
jgi:hypothetical protein